MRTLIIKNKNRKKCAKCIARVMCVHKHWSDIIAVCPELKNELMQLMIQKYKLYNKREPGHLVSVYSIERTITEINKIFRLYLDPAIAGEYSDMIGWNGWNLDTANNLSEGHKKNNYDLNYVVDRLKGIIP